MIHYKQDYKEYLKNQAVKYDYAIIDPPWLYNQPPKNPIKRNQLTYSLWESNANLIELLNSIDVEYVFLWVTNPLLGEVFDYISKTKFKYKAILTWIKLTKSGDIAYGMGWTFRNATEQLLVLQQKKVKPLKMNIKNVVTSPIRKRTAKPHEKEREIVAHLNQKGMCGIYLFSGGELDFIDSLDIV